MHTFSRKSRWVWMLALMLAGTVVPVHAQDTSNKDLAAQEVVAIDQILQQSDDVHSRQPLAQLYTAMAKDTSMFPREQTTREFERRFGEKAPSFGPGLQSDMTLSEGGGASQALNKSIKEQEEKAMFSRNLRFLDAYILGKYLSVFMNGDTSDSSYDIFLDVGEIQKTLVGDDGQATDIFPPRFSTGITNVGRYLKGSAVQAIQLDPNIRNQRIETLASGGTVKFEETGFPVCTVPGVVQEGKLDAFDETTKKAVLGRLVDLEEATKAATGTLNNTQLLNRQPAKDPVTKFFTENADLPNWSDCWQIICGRVDFIKTVPQLAPGLVGRPLPFYVSLQSIEDLARTLSNTPLETKYVGRSMFSPTFFGLNFLGQDYKATMTFEARFVPIYEAYDSSKVFGLKTFQRLAENYTSMLSGDLNRSINNAVNPDRLPASQVLDDSARQAYIEANKQQYKDQMLLRTQIYWNMTHLKAAGDRLKGLSDQMGAMQKLLKRLNDSAARLQATPTAHNK